MVSPVNWVSQVIVTVETFSREDFNSLKSEFKFVENRIQKGLDSYLTKNNDMILGVLQRSRYFSDFDTHELQQLVELNCKQMYLEPFQVFRVRSQSANLDQYSQKHKKFRLFLILQGQIS